MQRNNRYFFATEQTKNYGINGLRKILGAEIKNTSAVNTNTGLTFFYIYDFAVIFRRQSCRKSHSREAITLLLHGDVNFF